MNGYSLFHKAPELVPHHQMIQCPIKDTRCEGLTPLQRCVFYRQNTDFPRRTSVERTVYGVRTHQLSGKMFLAHHSVKNVMLRVSWDIKGSLIAVFPETGAIVNSASDCQLLIPNSPYLSNESRIYIYMCVEREREIGEEEEREREREKEKDLSKSFQHYVPNMRLCQANSKPNSVAVFNVVIPILLYLVCMKTVTPMSNYFLTSDA